MAFVWTNGQSQYCRLRVIIEIVVRKSKKEKEKGVSWNEAREYGENDEAGENHGVGRNVK